MIVIDHRDPLLSIWGAVQMHPAESPVTGPVDLRIDWLVLAIRFVLTRDHDRIDDAVHLRKPHLKAKVHD